MLEKAFHEDMIELDTLRDTFHTSKIVVVTAGNGGESALLWLKKHGFPVIGICDNTLEKCCTNTPSLGGVLSVRKTVAEYVNSVNYLVASYNQAVYYQLHSQLRKLGVSSKNIFHISLLETYVGSAAFSMKRLCTQAAVDSGQKDIEEILTFLEDDQSRTVFLKMLARVCHGYEYTIDDTYYSSQSGYFNHDFIQYDNYEVFIQCGVYHGETIQEFAKQCPKYGRILGIEADIDNLNEALSIKTTCDNVELVYGAVGDTDQPQKFLRKGHSSSRIVNSGIGEDVPGVRIDKLCSSYHIEPTFIQMDVEGAEMGALHGAAGAIQFYKPKLAVCIYHPLFYQHVPVEEYWKLIEYIHHLVPEYRLFVRSDSMYNDTVGIVVYAVE